MGSKSGFPVIIKRREVVAPVLPMQDHCLPMSNLDLLLPALDVGVFFCYKKPPSDGGENPMTAVGTLKKALAQALVCFYPFAGEVVPNCLGEPELLCNNCGVEFIHAFADVELGNLDLYHPDESVDEKLVPLKENGVLCVQVTELKCGGLVVGCTFDHRVADAHSANMFFIAWAEIAAGKPPSAATPSFRRSLLSPRCPGHSDPSIDDFYVPAPPGDQSDPIPGDDDHLLSRIYYIEGAQLDWLQSQAASAAGYRRSKLESFSSFLWKLVASGGRDPSKTCKIGIVVDGRERLSRNGKMDNYFGNVLSVPYTEATVGELTEMPLAKAAEAVHECVAGAATAEHFHDLVDWVEARRPERAIVRVYCGGDNEEAAVVVSSGRQFPAERVDFGWGPPALGSYHFPWGGRTGYVMPMPSPAREEDWVVFMHLLKKHLDLVDAKASHLFRPLTSRYLNLKE
ncbi:Alcohol O-acetyltransferase [Bertholletia excelsa]